MFSVRETAELLGISQALVNRLINEGHIHHQHLGKQYFIEHSEINNIILMKGHLLPDILVEYKKYINISLSETLKRGGIFHHAGGGSVREALGNALSLVKGMDESVMAPVIRMFLSRETHSLTCIGDGIVIPHANTPLVGNTSHPILSLSFLETPMEYDAPDGKPVQAMFLLISPNIRAHLSVLAKLSFVLRESEVRNAILNQDSNDDILAIFEQAEAEFHQASQDCHPFSGS